MDSLQLKQTKGSNNSLSKAIIFLRMVMVEELGILAHFTNDAVYLYHTPKIYEMIVLNM